MVQRIIFSGFGGQGIMSMSRLFAQAAMYENKHVTWFPSYGAEVRGGTSYCMVIISDRPIASPFIDTADAVIAMNKPSLMKFISRVAQKGLLILNSTLINKRPKIKKIKIAKYPFSDIASDIGDIRVANTIALGTLLKLRPIIKLNSMLDVLKEAFTNEHVFHVNEKALRLGTRLVGRRKSKG